MRRLALLLLAALARAEDAEPGPVPVGDVPVRQLVIAPKQGDASAALHAFLEAHALHKQGRADEALGRYLDFLGMPGRSEIPELYTTFVRERVDRLLAEVRERYRQACAVYARDRAKGLEELRIVALRHADLPEGKAALALRHSDALHGAMKEARALAAAGKQKEAAALLEKAIRSYPAAIRRYEAKSYLVDLGGPDLFEPGERVGDDEEEAPQDGPDEEGETEIEVSDG